MNACDLLEVFRTMADDVAKSYFWTDDIFYVYLNDAINKYCEKGKAIRDHTSELTLLEYTANDPWVILDEKVLKILSVYDNTTKSKLRLLDWDTFENSSSQQESADYNTFLSISRYPNATGTVFSAITGMEEDRLRLINIPVIDGSLLLIIDRYPLKEVNEGNTDIEGVPKPDRLTLLDWVMYRAYAHQDAETFDPDKSAISRAAFLAEMKEVDSRDLKKKHRSSSASGYGGI